MTGPSLLALTAERDRLARELEHARVATRELVEVLADWERTPGNQRTAEWWHNWDRKRRAALDKHKELS